MKFLKFTTLILVSLLGIDATAQTEATTAPLEGEVTSLFNVQAGLLGVFASYEAALSKRWTLRTEVGLDVFTSEAYRYNGSGLKKQRSTFLNSCN
jgi:hypothetical protein